MRIAVISDSHDRLPPSLPERLRGADEIWHLGDVCDPETLFALEQLGPPLRIVQGNCDDHPWPIELTLTREGAAFFLTHIPPPHPRVPEGVAAVLHGHTHMPRDETIAGVRWLNPGALSGPRGGSRASFAWLTLERDRPWGWKCILL